MVGDLLMQTLSSAVLKNKHPAAYGAVPSAKERKALKKPVMTVLAACLFVPLTMFALMFWLRSFDLRYQSAELVDIVSFGLFLVPGVFALQAFNMWNNHLDSKPMTLLFAMTALAYGLGFILGDDNFRVHMQPFYDIHRMNVYPSVDPAKYNAQQMMDAGQILFTPGSHLDITKSMGFKDGHTYCVAPIVSGDAKATQNTYDFWAIGMNCCSGHLPDFHCGEFSNPKATKGLRLMENDKRDMFHLVVQKASAEFNLKVAHPMFMYWLSDPEAEVQAYSDDGYGHFITSTCYFFCACLAMVASAIVAFAKL